MGSELAQPDGVSPGMVSLIVPAHNASQTLDRTLSSAIGQTYRELEIIVVDDASSDGTEDIVRTWAERDDRIRLVRNDTCSGVGGARNRGAAEASGAYLCFLDADDLLTQDAVEARLQSLQSANADFCFAWSAVIDDSDVITGFNERAIATDDIFAKLVLHGNILTNGSCIIVTRSTFEAVGGFSEALFAAGCQGCEDYKFYLDVAKRFKIASCERFLVGYRRSRGNMSGDGDRMMKSFVMVQKELLQSNPELAGMARRAHDMLKFYFATRSLRQGRLREAARQAYPLMARVPILALRTLAAKLKRWTRSSGALRRGSVFPYGTLCEAAAPSRHSVVS
ncbi:MAG: glycosyltransferase family A protein [Novosphingobium sp.]|nr:glycosyltransferase family A protein [Novosphingobium sp.]